MGMSDPWKHVPIGFIVPNLVAVGQTVCASVGGPKILGTLGSAPLGRGGSDCKETRLSPACVILPNSVALIINEIIQESLTLAFRPSRSLKVIGPDTDRSAINDFPLVFYSKYGPISHHFRHKGQFCIIFPHPCV